MILICQVKVCWCEALHL